MWALIIMAIAGGALIVAQGPLADERLTVCP
jgi:hypothetical protein